jgi:hypothetical protein
MTQLCKQGIYREMQLGASPALIWSIDPSPITSTSLPSESGPYCYHIATIIQSLSIKTFLYRFIVQTKFVQWLLHTHIVVEEAISRNNLNLMAIFIEINRLPLEDKIDNFFTFHCMTF